MKYVLIFIVIFLFIRLMDKENPLIGEPIEQPFFELIEENKPKNRPTNLPGNAVWRGGVDGGNYIVLPTPVENEDDIYYAEIYSDATGKLIYKGRFRHMHSEYSTCESVDPTKADNHVYWDGETWNFLDTGQYLLPIDPNTLDLAPFYLNELKNIGKNNYCGSSEKSAQKSP